MSTIISNPKAKRSKTSNSLISIGTRPKAPSYSTERPQRKPFKGEVQVKEEVEDPTTGPHNNVWDLLKNDWDVEEKLQTVKEEAEDPQQTRQMGKVSGLHLQASRPRLTFGRSIDRNGQ